MIAPLGRLVPALLFLVCLCLPTGVLAHSRSESFSAWSVGEAHVALTLRMTARDATVLPRIPGEPLENAVARSVGEGIRLRSGGGACRLAGPASAQLNAEAMFEVRALFRCETGGRLEADLGFLWRGLPGHIHFARVLWPGASADYVLSARQAGFHAAPDAAAPEAAAVGIAVLLGVEHILSGPDHLAFLLGLILLASSPRALVILATGFTLGHSASLALAALGHLRPDTQITEAVIGASVALLALENLVLRGVPSTLVRWGAATVFLACALVAAARGSAAGALGILGLAVFAWAYFEPAASRRDGRVLAAVTLVFGLVHGVGFAGVLSEARTGDGLLWRLFGFNLGVELGQLAFIAACAAIGVLLVRLGRGRLLQQAAGPLCVALAAVGTYWFIARGLA